MLDEYDRVLIQGKLPKKDGKIRKFLYEHLVYSMFFTSFGWINKNTIIAVVFISEILLGIKIL